MNKLLLFLLILFAFPIHAQHKDTIVVYEEVIEYDTVYVKKAGGVVVDIQHEQRASRKRRKKLKEYDFGISMYAGAKDINFFKSLGGKNNYGTGLGIWYRKSLFFPEMSFSIGANLFYWPKTYELNSYERNHDFLEGFYFMENSQPILFQSFSNEHTEINVPLKFNYTWNDWTYFLGFFANYTSFKMQFLVPEERVLTKSAYFKAKQFNYGYSAGVQYSFDRLHLSIEYQQYEFLEMAFKNNDVGNLNLKLKNGFLDNKILLGIHYSFKK